MKAACVILRRGPPPSRSSTAQARGPLLYARSVSQENVIVAKLIPHSLHTRVGRNSLTSVIPRAAGVIREAPMTSTDLFRRRANEWRRVAVRARNADDKVFWLGLVERWEAARQRCLRSSPRSRFRSSQAEAKSTIIANLGSRGALKIGGSRAAVM
jgi:hypothetical protein